MMRLFDSHAHVYDKQFDSDRDSMLKNVFRTLDYVVCPSENVETSRQTVALLPCYAGLYGAVGIHPHETKNATDEALQEIANLAKSDDKVVAIGEIGLDYYYFYSPKEIQKIWFEKQIELAKELDLPIIIHDREAHGDTFSILKKQASTKLRGIMHCYGGSVEMAKELMKLGFYISFAGPVVFPKSSKLKEVAKAIPLDRLLIETDSPYLTPPPHRGERNNPSYVRFVAEEIARLKQISVETVVEQTRQNALHIYQIKK